MSNTETIKYKTYENVLISELENDIINEKLSQGVNGIEWLVLSIKAQRHTTDVHHIWHMNINYRRADVDQLVIDNFLLSPNDFHDKYELNWWISFNHSIYQLQLMKERDYDEYFKLLQLYEEAN